LQGHARNIFVAHREVIPAAPLVGQEIEEIGIGVFADGDRRKRRAIGQRIVEQPLVAFSGARAGLAVGEKDDVAGVGFGVTDGIEPNRECGEYFGAAIRLNRRDLAVDCLTCRFVADRRQRDNPLLPIVEDDDADLIALGE
jgi:hypothetical protein